MMMGAMRPAYVQISLESEGLSYVVSPAPWLYRQGELVVPPGTKICEANSYAELRAVLKAEFHISDAMLPSAKYFEPTESETENEELEIYRTVPNGAGEPEWRTNARQALIYALDEVNESLISGDERVILNDKVCGSLEEVKAELLIIAEKAGGRKRNVSEAYPPDY